MRDLLARAAIDGTVDFLAAATTQGDLCVPGFAKAARRCWLSTDLADAR